MNTDIFITYIKAEDIYVGIAKELETKFGTSNYELDNSLLRAKNKQIN